MITPRQYKTLMKNLISILLILVFCISCKRDSDSSSNIEKFLPDSFSYIISSPDMEEYLKNVDSIALFHENNSFIPPHIRRQIIQLRKNAEQKHSLLSFKADDTKEPVFLYISTGPVYDLKLDSLKNSSKETFTYENYMIIKYVLEDVITYVSGNDEVFLASNSRTQLEMINRGDFVPVTEHAVFNKTYLARDQSKTSILINHINSGGWLGNLFPNIDLPLNAENQWSIIEPENVSDKIKLNGITTWQQNRSLLQIFRNVGVQPNHMARVSPVNSLGFYSFTYSDYDLFIENLNQYRDSIIEIPSSHLLSFSEEAGIIFSPKENLLAIRTTDPTLAGESLLPFQELVKEFRGVPVYTQEETLNISSYLRPLLPQKKWSYYIWLEDFIIFSESTSSLENIISNFLNKTTLAEQSYYAEAMENMAGDSSLLLVAHNKNSKSARPQTSGDLNNLPGPSSYPVIALQWVAEKDFAHLHAVLHPDKNGAPGSSILEQLASFNLDAPAASGPYPVKNRINGVTEILVQDQENMLYRYSAKGDLIWKKQYTHRILGTIQQADMLKNANFQNAFSTPYALHVIDRNGNPVKPFPLEFKEEITQPLSIFDYDNDRTYRFAITQGNNILLYDTRGRQVQGFDFDPTGSSIIHPPKHIRINNKDHLLVPEDNGKLNVLSRQGKSRITVKEEIEFSENKWYPFKGDFISSNASGNLVYVKESGEKEESSSPSNGNLKLVVEEDLLVTLNENILNINGKEITLDYGLYSHPSVFSDKGKIFIALTDTQAQRAYIFNEQGNLLPGFPVYGSGDVKMISSEGNSYIFSVQGGGNEIIVYRFMN